MYAYALHFAGPIDNSVANIVLCSRVNGACFSVLDTHARRAWILLRGQRFNARRMRRAGVGKLKARLIEADVWYQQVLQLDRALIFTHDTSLAQLHARLLEHQQLMREDSRAEASVQTLDHSDGRASPDYEGSVLYGHEW